LKKAEAIKKVKIITKPVEIKIKKKKIIPTEDNKEPQDLNKPI
jgi:hypothetical protein